MAGRRKGAAERAVFGELKAMDSRLAGASASAAAAVALELARQLDDPGNSATSKSMCSGSLLAAMESLRAVLPPEVAGDDIDDLAARRVERLASVAGA